MKVIISFIFCIATFGAFAQNLQGIYTGNYGKSFMMTQPQKIDFDIIP